MIRNALPTLLVFAIWGIASPAEAQTFGVTAVELRNDSGGVLTENEIKLTYFNRAKCECARPIPIKLRITPNTTGSDQDRIYVVVGTGTCINTNDNSIAAGCTVLFTEFVRNLKGDQDLFINEGEGDDTVEREPTAADLMLNRCTEDLDVNLYVFKGLENSLTDITPTPVTLSVDGQLPVTPTSERDPEPGEGIVSVRFTSGSDTEPNARYQVLCERADTGEPGLSSPPGAGYEVTTAMCVTTTSNDGGVDGATADSGTPDAGVDATPADDATTDGPLSDGAPADAGTSDLSPGDMAPSDAAAGDDATDATPSEDTTPDGDSSATTSTGITSLDPRFVCSEASPSDGTITVKGLENEVVYRFYVVAIDEHKNASSPVLLGEATPVLAEDLWERYKRSGGSATGGFCAVGGEQGAGVLLLATLLLATLHLWGLARRRRSRR